MDERESLEKRLEWREASCRQHEEGRRLAERFPAVSRPEREAELKEFDRRIELDRKLADDLRERLRRL